MTSLNIRHIVTVLACLTITAASYAQSIGKIRKDNACICADGTGHTPAGADSSAVISLSGKIAEAAGFTSIQVPVRAKLMQGYFNDIRQSSFLISDGRSKAFRYIYRDRIKDIFSARKDKIREMLDIADKAAAERKADIALRYWNWAVCLMKSVPPLDADRIAETEAKIKRLMDGLHVRYTKPDRYDRNIIELEFTLNGKPVQSIDYKFFDGASWSGVLSAKDGKGFAKVPPDASVTKFRVSYEIRPELLPHIWREIKQIEMAYEGNVKKESPAPAATPAPENVKKVDYAEVKKKIIDVISGTDSEAADSTAVELRPVSDVSGYESAVEKIREALTDRDYGSVRDLFTDEGFDIFRELLEYGSVRVLESGDITYYRLGDETYARSIPMVFSFPKSGREFLEDIVLTFDGDGKVSNITFALGKSTIRDIASHTNWPEEARIILMSFLENYKTAYALKRLDYISSIFDEDALIITGRVLKSAGKANEFGAGKYVTLTRQNKAEYIRRLGTVFASQEFININLTDCEVMKLGKAPALYGIKIRQEYYSSTYSDTGYLFILVDLRDYEKPVIHVRTWQEAPDKDFGVIGPYNF